MFLHLKKKKRAQRALASSDERNPFPNISQYCQDGLVDLVKIFHDIDRVIYNEINQLLDDGVENK
jgi:hypothetical protein